MMNTHKLVAAIALATTSVTVSAEQAATAPVYPPYAPVAMTAVDQQKLAAQHQAFATQQAAALKAAMESQRKLVEQIAAERARVMQDHQTAMAKHIEDMRKAHAAHQTAMPHPAGYPTPYAMPEMPVAPQFAMPEMPVAPEFAMPELPAPPSFEPCNNWDPQARREAMYKAREEMRAAMEKRRQQMRKQIEERRAALPGELATDTGTDV